MANNFDEQPNNPTGRAWLRALILRDPARWSSRLGSLMSWLKMIGRGQRRRFGRAAAGLLAGASGLALMAMLAGPMVSPVAAASPIIVDGTCTLIDAIKAANTDALAGECTAGSGADTIILGIDPTYTTAYLGENALPGITTDITIQADSGTRTITLDPGTAFFRAFQLTTATGSLTLENINISGGRVTAALGGGQIHTGAGTSLTIDGGTFSGGYSGINGGSVYSLGNSVTISNAIFTSNYAKQGGGAVRIFNVTPNTTNVVVANTVISGNISMNQGGGGMRIGQVATVNISDTDFINNQAKGASSNWGGGLFAGLVPSATLSNVTATGNYGEGAAGGILFNIVNGTITGSTISGNSTTADAGGLGIWNGNSGGRTYKVTVTNTTINNNTAGDYGGGVEVFGTPTTFDNVIVNDNVAATYGGGMVLTGSGIITVTNSTVNNNTAATQGGGIYTSSPTFISNTIINNNVGETGGGVYNGGVLQITDSTIMSNTATAYGGGVYHAGSDLTVSGSTISNNYAKYYGGGVYSDGTLLITDTVISNNTTTVSSGAILNGDEATIVNSTISNNSADAYAGAIFNPKPNTLTISGSTINNNSTDGYGGGIYSGGTLQVTDSTISSNTAGTYGGGVTVWNGTTTISGSTISDNAAATFGGGFVLGGTTGTVTFTGSVISNNTATTYGGGVALTGGTMTITNSQVLNNTATNVGGGAAAKNAADLFVLNSTFSGNVTTSSSGGGVYTGPNVDLTVTGSVFTDNKSMMANPAASSKGGGIFAGKLRWAGGSAGTGVVTIDDSTFDSNYTKDSGGGIYTTRVASVTISDSSITNNTSTRWAAGAGFWGHAVTIENSDISGNNATRGAGAIYCGYNYAAGLAISNSTLSDNSAGYSGGAIYSRRCETEIVNSTLSENAATQKGGAIYAYDDKDNGVSLTHTTIVSNTSGQPGGGLFAYDGLFTISSSIIAGNSATTGGDDVHNNSNKASISVSNSVLGDSAKANAAAFGGNVTFGSGTVRATSDGDEPTALSGIVKSLADNGGLGTLPGGDNTMTHLLVGGSPAIDILLGASCDVATDQRGEARPQGDGCDAGAVEIGVGTINIRKLTTPAGLLDVFDFTSDIAGSETFTLTHGLTETMSVAPGVFTVTESAADGFTLDDIDCTTGGEVDGDIATITIGEDDEVTCTFTNSQDAGEVVIKKLTNPSGLAKTFSFTSTSALSPTFSLSDGGIVTLTVPTGLLTVTESAAANFSLSDIDCDQPGAADKANRRAIVEVTKDETVTCTFTNNRDSGTLRVTKVISPTGLTDSFTFTVTNGIDDPEVFTLSDTLSKTLTLPTGSYTVTQSSPAGFELLEALCDDVPDRSGRGSVSNSVRVTINKDQTVTCTFSNEVIEDEDGVTPTTEGGAPNGGDGNGDGVPDYLQNHVTSLPNGVNDKYVSIAAPDGTQMTAVSTGPAPATLPGGVQMPIGVISFTLKNLTAGQTVQVTLHLQDAISANAYYKLISGVWTEYENVEFVDNKTIVLTLTDGGAGDLDGTANGEIRDPGGPGLMIGDAEVFISTWSAGKVGGLTYGPHDVLGWDSEAGKWTTWFAGADAGLDPYRKWKHNLNAIYIPDTAGDDLIFSLTQDNRKVPGITGIVDGMDLLRWDGDALSIYFDGQDVGLNVKTQEKIDGLHILAEAPEWSERAGYDCEAYLLISVQGTGTVPMPIPGKPKNVLKFSGEDVLGFCATNLGQNTTGFWEMVLDGSVEGLKKSNLDSLAANDDASVIYLTTQKEIRLDDAFGGHSMVFAFDMETRRFSGPYVRVMDDLGIQPKVDALHVTGELTLP